jgi:exopolysaccharide biosynthesis polyprenyl glycosylphosphotransferase
MLRTYAAFFSLVRSVIDILILAACWVVVYFVRFYSGLFGSPKGIPDFRKHLILTLPVVCICYLACWWAGLYKPKRIQNMFKQFLTLLKAGFLGGLLTQAFLYYAEDVLYSRKLLALFVIMVVLGLSFSHLLVIGILRLLRKKGYNLRHYAVIGAGRKGQLLVQDIQRMGWSGLKCDFFIDNDPNLIGSELLGVKVYGPVEEIHELLNSKQVDEVYLAMAGSEARKVYPILESLQLSGMTIRIIPDWGNLLSMGNPVVIPVGSQLLFSAADSTLSGHKVILKQIFDLILAFMILIVASIPMLVIALLIRLSSKGPVLYKQIRTGMDQREFEILKFRTMKSGAEDQSGPQWSKPDDARCTRIGKWLRNTSLDELPQLLNVLKGQMSLVGPRPERPHFVKQFSEEYRRYMLRHKVKAGITGWAQINGFRGDTSLRKRLVYDLYYVRNWSFALDFWVLLWTPLHIIKRKNAH